jgi:hypothetical protein
VPDDVVRPSLDIRGVFWKLIKKGLTVSHVAWLFDATGQTVHRWLKAKTKKRTIENIRTLA